MIVQGFSIGFDTIVRDTGVLVIAGPQRRRFSYDEIRLLKPELVCLALVVPVAHLCA